MALQGTIKDFGLPDIFQLIGIQRKTGLLTLERGPDKVTVKFLDGQVVGAETSTESPEERLGRLLVRSGRITEAQLQDALRIQHKTLQRLGYVLVRSASLSETDLIDALKIQSTQIIYRLFRWRDGIYHFSAVEDLEYDQKHFTPISSETILMEGARMIDEWPIIERRIKSARMVLKRTEAGETLQRKVASLVDSDADFKLGFGLDRPLTDEPSEAPTVKLSGDEQVVLALIDGKRAVEEICDLSNLGEFETYRVLSELMPRSLIEEVSRTADAAKIARGRRLAERMISWTAHGAIGLLVVWGLVSLAGNPLTPWHLLQGDGEGDRLRLYASQAQLERIERAIQVFYMDAGSFPRDLEPLARNGYLESRDLRDPWGRLYVYELAPGGYQLYGLDAAEQASPTLTVSHAFNSVERMMLAGGASSP